jgi:hypothetical protein
MTTGATLHFQKNNLARKQKNIKVLSGGLNDYT